MASRFPKLADWADVVSNPIFIVNPENVKTLFGKLEKQDKSLKSLLEKKKTAVVKDKDEDDNEEDDDNDDEAAPHAASLSDLNDIFNDKGVERKQIDGRGPR